MKTWSELEVGANDGKGVWILSRRRPHCAGVEFIRPPEEGYRYELEFWVEDKFDKPWVVGRLAAELLAEDTRRGRNSLDTKFVETRIRCAGLILKA